MRAVTHSTSPNNTIYYLLALLLRAQAFETLPVAATRRQNMLAASLLCLETVTIFIPKR